MRATVGPLPSAVYWRRRAVVLGAVLLGVIVLFMSCSNEDDKDPNAKDASSQYPTPAPASDEKSASPDPSILDSAPPVGPALPDPAELLTQQPGDDEDALPTTPPASAPTTGTNGNAAVPTDGSCADTEVSVTPIPADTTIKRGTPVDIRLKIKNISTRTCNRDVGADAQELYLEQGAQKFWSSDPCSTANGSEVKSFAPGAEREYRITWNGRQSTQCANGQASGPVLQAGQYELRGRLSQIISKPVVLSVVA
ncbi:adhesin [Actinoplanes sp. GCM10030250]|uniref:adhesin n=1 Tax=Actinoplanes sp. GCM10030250 TaxID=3273376 RepID=UPI00361BEC5B